MQVLSRSIRQIAQDFEEAWFSSKHPEVLSFFSQVRSSLSLDEQASLLFHLIQIDQELRQRNWSNNAPTVVHLEGYAREFPEIFSGRTVPEDIILAEFRIRRQSDNTLDIREFAERFGASDKVPILLESIAKNTFSIGSSNFPSINGYVLLSIIGKGGMGTVYSAIDTKLGREVALKLISAPDLSNEAVSRFLREAKILASFDSEHFLPIYDVGFSTDPKGIPYYSMRLVRGSGISKRPVTLTELVREKLKIEWPLPDRLRIFCEIAKAVALTHRCTPAVLHRDLKPSNVIIDENTKPWLIDWGLAKQVTDLNSPVQKSDRSEKLESELTSSGKIIGTPAFMAPEQALGDQSMISTQTDVFGLGGILFFMLTGKPLFEGRSREESLSLARNGDVRDRLAFVPTETDKLVVDLLHRALSKSPSKRHSHAGELCDELDFWFTTQESRKRQREITELKRPLVKRVKLLKLGLVFLAIAAVTILGWWQVVRFAEIRRKEDAERATIATARSSVERIEEWLVGGDKVNAQSELKNLETIIRNASDDDLNQSAHYLKQLIELHDKIDQLREVRLLQKFESDYRASALQELSADIQSSLLLAAESNVDKRAVCRVMDVYSIELIAESKSNNTKKLAMDRLSELSSRFSELGGRSVVSIHDDKTSIEIAALRDFDIGPGLLDIALRNIESPDAQLQFLIDLEINHPKNFWLNIYIAALLYNMDSDDPIRVQENRGEATRWARAALDRRPDSKSGIFTYGVLLDRRQNGEMKRLYAIVKNHYEESWLAAFIDARKLLSESDARAAVALLERATELGGPYKFLLNQRLECLLAIGEVDAVDAILEGDPSIDRKSKEYGILRLYTLIYRGKARAAIEASDELAVKFPASPLSAIGKVLAHTIQGRLPEALMEYEQLSPELRSLPELQNAEYAFAAIKGDNSKLNALQLSSIGNASQPYAYWQLKGGHELSSGKFESAASAFTEGQRWLSKQRAKLPAIALFTSPEIEQFRILAISQMATLDKQIQGVSDEEIADIFSKQSLLGFEVYFGDYLYLKSDYRNAVACFNRCIPPGIGKSTRLDQLLAELSESLGVDLNFEDGANAGEVFSKVQSAVAVLGEAEKARRLQALLQTVSKVDFGEFPSVGGRATLRLEAAMAALYVASGYGQQGKIAKDEVRRKHMELAIQWLEAEILSVEKRVDELVGMKEPIKFQMLSSLNRRLSMLLVHRDFEILRSNSSKSGSEFLEYRPRIQDIFDRAIKLYETLREF